MGTCSLGGGKEGSSIRPKVRLDCNGGESISCFNDLYRDNELCSSRPCTTKGLDDSGDHHTRVKIIFNMETYAMVKEGKGKNLVSEESLRIPTRTLSRLDCPRKGTPFITTLWRYRVIWSSWSKMIIFP
jgi:hypothetical protein